MRSSTIMRRAGALLLSAVLTAAIAVPAFAAAMPGSGVSESTDTSIVLKKEVVFINTAGADVYEPNVTYSYAIVPAAPTETGVPANDTSIKDVDGHIGYVHAGVAGVLTITPSVSYSASNAVVTGVTAAGTSVTKDITVTVADLAPLNGRAGIYRYKITETVADADLTSAGITRDTDYDSVRYLDLYVRNNETTNALEVYGYVLFDGADTTSLDATSVNPASADLDVKTAGYVRDDDNDGSTDAEKYDNVDVYYTYNLKLTKEITGGLADKTHKFSFLVEMGDSDTAAAFTYINPAGTAGKTTFAGFQTAVSGLVLGNGEHIEMKGVPAGATLNITETNDTLDAYKVTITNTRSGAVTAAATKAKDETMPMAAALTKVTDYATARVTSVAEAAQAYGDIKYENKIEEVSPTGIVFRFMPFLIMATLALILLMVARRRTDERPYTL